MTALSFPYRTVECRLCGHPVPEANLEDHLLADYHLLGIIQVVRPEWSRIECESYLRASYGDSNRRA